MIRVDIRPEINLIQEQWNGISHTRVVEQVIGNCSWFDTVIQFVLVTTKMVSEQSLCVMPGNDVAGSREVITEPLVQLNMNGTRIDDGKLNHVPNRMGDVP
jgi:hypothetical protein